MEPKTMKVFVYTYPECLTQHMNLEKQCRGAPLLPFPLAFKEGFWVQAIVATFITALSLVLIIFPPKSHKHTSKT